MTTMSRNSLLITLRRIPKDKKRSVTCSLIGHSKIVSACFGYIYCGRCEAQIADKLGSSYPDAPNCVQIGHNCKTCRTNYRKLDWRDKYLVPNPFKELKGLNKTS